MLLGALIIVFSGLLFVNYLKHRTEFGSVPSVSTGAKSAENKTEVKTHRVAAGESLWIISEKYYGTGFSWSKIAEANKIDNAGYIEKDQELIIPEVASTAIAARSDNTTAESKQPVTESKETISSATYEVVKGDSLWNIAVRAYGDGYKWVEIAKENKLTNPNLIHSGNILVLPR